MLKGSSTSPFHPLCAKKWLHYGVVVADRQRRCCRSAASLLPIGNVVRPLFSIFGLTTELKKSIALVKYLYFNTIMQKYQKGEKTPFSIQTKLLVRKIEFWRVKKCLVVRLGLKEQDSGLSKHLLHFISIPTSTQHTCRQQTITRKFSILQPFIVFFVKFSVLLHNQ